MELGLPITQEQINELKANADDIYYDVAKEQEKKVRHDVMSHDVMRNEGYIFTQKLIKIKQY